MLYLNFLLASQVSSYLYAVPGRLESVRDALVLVPVLGYCLLFLVIVIKHEEAHANTREKLTGPGNAMIVVFIPKFMRPRKKNKHNRPYYFISKAAYVEITGIKKKSLFGCSAVCVGRDRNCGFDDVALAITKAGPRNSSLWTIFYFLPWIVISAYLYAAVSSRFLLPLLVNIGVMLLFIVVYYIVEPSAIRKAIKAAKDTPEGDTFSYLISDGTKIFLHKSKQFREFEEICKAKHFKNKDFDTIAEEFDNLCNPKEQ